MLDYDLVIIGGGLVGGSLACALRDTGLRIAVVEAVAADAAVQPSYDERVIALSLGSRRIFGGMGLWDAMAGEAEAILRVHVSERGQCGFTHLDHRDEGVEALGYVAAARAMGMAIDRCLRQAPAVELLRPARLVGLHPRASEVDLEVALDGQSRLLRTGLLVAADGGDSAVRRRLGLSVRERGYDHHAIISTVTPARPQAGTAFERFTESGPLAMLPMTAGRYSVVWTAREHDSAGILGLDDDAFIARLQERFGNRLGRLTRPGRRIAYPLRMLLANELTRPRMVLIGNAAHTLHPVAGQGFNLGLRDVAELTDLLVQAKRGGDDIGGERVLNGYRERRAPEHRAAAMLTDALARLFVNPWAPVRLGRNLGMLALDFFPGARHGLARRFMGTGGRLPRLARGLAPADDPR